MWWVTEKGTYVNIGCKFEIPYLLTVLLSTPFDKLPLVNWSWNHRISSAAIRVQFSGYKMFICSVTRHNLATVSLLAFSTLAFTLFACKKMTTVVEFLEISVSKIGFGIYRRPKTLSLKFSLYNFLKKRTSLLLILKEANH